MVLGYKGISLYYTDQGKGTPVVLLHGFLENSSMWQYLTPKLLEKNRVIAIDLLGHGNTECLGYIHTMEDMADAVNAILIHLKIGKVIFIGHSMGGYVSLAFADHFQDKVLGLCLANSSAREDSLERKLNRDRAIKAVKQNHRAFISMSIANLFAPKNRAVFKKEIEAIKEDALKTPLQGIVAALEGMKIRPNTERLLHTTSFKKLMIIGIEDPVLDARSLREQTKDTLVEIIEFSGGHMSFIEEMYAFDYKIKHFIENI
jgi:pimeloyl-ACP methyl ester carboxylesterase